MCAEIRDNYFEESSTFEFGPGIRGTDPPSLLPNTCAPSPQLLKLTKLQPEVALFQIIISNFTCAFPGKMALDME